MSGAIDLPLERAEIDHIVSGGARFRRTVHPSGLRILTEEVPGAASATVGFWVAVGSRDENEVAYGSTHFLEHLLFKRTQSRSALDIAVAFDAVGGEHNAMTAKEHTCYYAKIQDHDLPMAIDVLADMICSSVIDPSDFDVERHVILEELAMADDDPHDVAHERIAQLILGEHPLGRPIGGNPETIRAAERDQVHEYYRRFYRPDELVVTVAGALNHERVVASVLDALSRYGWDLANAGAPAPRRARTQAHLSPTPEPLVLSRPLEQATIVLGMPGLTQTDPRRPVHTVLSTVLGGGMSSRLFQEIREKRGLAYSVYSYSHQHSDTGIFGMAAGTAPEHVTTVAQLMTEALRDIATDGITEAEWQRTRGNISGSLALALESTDARMIRLGRAEIHTAEFVDRDEALRRLEQVSPDDVLVLAREIASSPLSAVAVGALGDDVADGLPRRVLSPATKKPRGS